MHACMYVCMYVCMHVCMHVYLSIYLSIYLSVCLSVYIYVYIYICIYVRKYVCGHQIPAYLCTFKPNPINLRNQQHAIATHHDTTHYTHKQNRPCTEVSFGDPQPCIDVKWRVRTEFGASRYRSGQADKDVNLACVCVCDCVYVCMHVCVGAPNVCDCMYVCMHVCVGAPNVCDCMYVYMHVCVGAPNVCDCMYVCMHVCVGAPEPNRHGNTQACRDVDLACVYECMYVFMHVCICVHIACGYLCELLYTL
jgi:hypothetical protein